MERPRIPSASSGQAARCGPSPLTQAAVDAVEMVDCPACAAPAVIQFSSMLESTGGPVEHLRITCVRQHTYLLPRDMLAIPTPADEPVARSRPT
jgi:hypothetical protein